MEEATLKKKIMVNIGIKNKMECSEVKAFLKL